MPFEVSIIIFLQSLSSVFLDMFFKATAYFFDYPLVIVLGLLFLIFRKYAHFFLFIIVEVVGCITQIILKAIINRPRPYVSHNEIRNILEAGNSSFPSGHSITCMCAVIVLWYIVKKSNIQQKYKTLSYVGLVLACVLCMVNRMYLGQHYITDVLAGFIIAFFISFISIKVYDKVNLKLKDKKA